MAAPNFAGNNAITERDHLRMLDLLHITTLRRGRDGGNPQSPFAVNYEEARANPLPNLPDPPVFLKFAAHYLKVAAPVKSE